MLPSSRTITDLLTRADARVEEEVEEALSESELERADEDLSRLSLLNKRELKDAEAYVEQLGSVDDFEPEVRSLLETAFRAWDDGGRIDALGDGLVRLLIPARLRGELRRSAVERATFRREVAVVGQDDPEGQAPEFLSPAHPLVDSVLRKLREEAADPTFDHRFDVEVGEPRGLVLSFALRFVDGDGRTADEQLEAVEVRRDFSLSSDPSADFARPGGGPGNRLR